MTIDLNDTYVKRWLTGLAPKTKENYPPMLEDWLTFIGMTPTEQIQKRMHDLTSTDITERCFFEDKWRAFKESMEATGTHNDGFIHDRLKVVSSFFTRNGLPLSLKKGDWNSTQKQDVKEKKMKLDIDDVKRLYGHANLRDKCLLLILAQSGFSEVDITELKVEDIQNLYGMPVNEHYVIEKNRDKMSSHLQATCLSYEFLHDLRDLLIERGNPKNGFIFTSQTKGKDVEHINERRINEAMQTLAEKTFGNEKVKGTETLKKDAFQTRMLRSFYNSALLRARIQPQELKDLMMGHDQGGARKNYDHDDETIKQAYIQAFDFLSINGIQSREDMQKIKSDLNQLIGQQQVQLEAQKQQREKDQERITKLEEWIKTNTATDPNTISKIVSSLENITTALVNIQKEQQDQKKRLDALEETERQRPEKVKLT
jgi:integrase